MDTDPAKISGGATISCGDMGSLAYGGVSKNWQGGILLTSFINLTRAREGGIIIIQIYSRSPP